MKAANLTIENEDCGYSAEPRAWVSQTMAAAMQTLRTWRKRASGRRALSQLSQQMLSDIDVEPREAMREASKPFWRA